MKYMHLLENKKQSLITFFEENFKKIQYSKVVLDKDLFGKLYFDCHQANGVIERLNKNRYVLHIPAPDNDYEKGQTIVDVTRVEFGDSEDEYQVNSIKSRDIDYKAYPDWRKQYFTRNEQKFEEEMSK